MNGKCTWGANCRFLHPGVNDKGKREIIVDFQEPDTICSLPRREVF